MTKNPRRARALLAATALTLLGSVGGLAAAPPRRRPRWRGRRRSRRPCRTCSPTISCAAESAAAAGTSGTGRRTGTTTPTCPAPTSAGSPPGRGAGSDTRTPLVEAVRGRGCGEPHPRPRFSGTSDFSGSQRVSAAQGRWRAHRPELLVLFKSSNERVTRAASSPSGGPWSASQTRPTPLRSEEPLFTPRVNTQEWS